MALRIEEWEPHLRSRYGEPRTLRTRATGTPFRAAFSGSELVITTWGGSKRIASMSELARAFPLVAAGASLSKLKTVTNNASYLEALFDDLQVMSRESSKPLAALVDGGPATPPPVEAPQAQLAALRAEYEVQLRDLRRELESVRAKQGRLQNEMETLRSDLMASKTTQVEAQKKLKAAIDRAIAAEASQAPAQTAAYEAQLRDLRRELESARAKQGRLENEMETLRSALMASKTAQVEAQKKLKAAIDRAIAAEASHAPGSQQILLAVSDGNLVSEHLIAPELWKVLAEAAKLAFAYPAASVTASRRALEMAISQLWKEADARDGKESMSDMLHALRGHRVMPDADWHLAKNLYGRASAIVHDGTDRADLALWIFFGAVQVCELVPGSKK